MPVFLGQTNHCRDDEVTLVYLFFPLLISLCRSQWFEDKFQEVEIEEQQLRKLQAVVDSLVNHRKGELHISFCCC